MAIPKLIASLQNEERELAAVEDALVRLFNAPGDLFDHPAEAETITPPTEATTTGGESAVVAEADEAEDDLSFVGPYVKSIMKGNETIEELIVLLLENCKDTWWTASEVQSCLSDLKGRQISMSTVSPLLWTMRKRGIIVREGLNVALASKLESNRAAAE